MTSPPVTWTPFIGVDEWSVLTMVAELQALDAEPDARAGLLSSPDFDHGRLIEHAMRHKLGAALADFVTRHGLRRSIPVPLRNPLYGLLQAAQHRSAVLTRHAVAISTHLQAVGLSFAWTKGVVAQTALYDNSGVRVFNDIDLMIHPRHRGELRSELLELGFIADNVWDPATKTLVPRSRTELRTYQLSPDHLPHFHRVVADLLVPVVIVDVANSLTWHNAPWTVPMDPVMDTRRTDPELPVLSAEYSFLFTCLHLFREGWLDRFTRIKGIALALFGDVLREWRRLDAAARKSVGQIIGEHDLFRPMAWVCRHTDLLFDTTIADELDLLEYAAPEWLAEAMGADGRTFHRPGGSTALLGGPASHAH
ncbi:nucleotidyltransferase family protein [Nocardia sp. NPDC052566]|uniref:nucleotidyltransferase family protein n=1 Tax=Nocardia sp. NPDC052566 TaxID=3364330 RepID=UPI0037C6F93A